MRISDWSSDVCSSDLPDLPLAALVYVDDTGKGITRKKHRIGWAYFDARGRRIEDAEDIRRLNGIGLPPAYVNCWFCPDPSRHLQAIGLAAPRSEGRHVGKGCYRRCGCGWVLVTVK